MQGNRVRFCGMPDWIFTSLCAVLVMTASVRADISLWVSPAGPGFTSLASAITQVQRFRRDTTHADQPVTITLHAGTYYLPEKLVIPPDVGPLTITAPINQSVVLTGGTKIEGWKTAMFNGHACWSADVLAARLRIWNFRELWVNGKRATRARYPAQGYLAAVIPEQSGKELGSRAGLVRI